MRTDYHYDDSRQPDKKGLIDELIDIFLDNYRLWMVLFIILGVSSAYPNTVISLLNIFISVPIWLLNFLSSLTLPIILIIFGIVIFIMGRYRESKKRRSMSRRIRRNQP